MQPFKRLINALDTLATREHYLFTPKDFKILLPDLSQGALKVVLSRATKGGYLERICRGLYLYKRMIPPTGLLLFHAAARLRAHEFNYLSLETVLSDAGVISQVPIQWIAVMSSGRSSLISCGRWGSIQFVHTRQKPEALIEYLIYDARCRLWRATVPQAIRDMKATHHSLDLIDWSISDEYR